MIFAITVIPTLVGLFLAAFLFDYVAVKMGKGWATFFRGGYLPATGNPFGHRSGGLALDVPTGMGCH